SDRVDQERHVVVDDLDHRASARPAVAFLGGIEYPQAGRAWLARLQQRPGRKRRADQRGFAHREHVVGRRAGKELFDEAAGVAHLATPGLPSTAGGESLDEGGFRLFGPLQHHSVLSLAAAPARRGYRYLTNHR